VLRLDPREQQVVVGERSALDCGSARVEGASWTAGTTPTGPIRVRVQVRHRHRGALAKVHATEGGGARIEFEEPVAAVAPGQAAVFYDAEHDEEVLGGGWLVRGRA
jgi:tRNA-specific 2-thiouridylase